MNSSTRVRFAPSPTGFLHIGGARTALFNWLFARATSGKFLLRIEDTDPTRSETRFTDDIKGSLEWLGLKWDEPPVFQSQRFEIYQKTADDLQKKGLAYPCECTQVELDAIREKCIKEKRPFRYPGICREKKSVSSTSVIRVKVPQTGQTSFGDLIRGEITLQNRDIDDWVILRADCSPTYNFSVVIDDHDQGITHVLRGDDHINNTPKQILLYQTLGLPLPKFAHLPMILGADRSKLSKRHGALSTLEYQKMGYLPQTMINFLVRLGWSHKDQEIFTIEELVQHFSLDKIGKANAIFNVEKLNWLSGQYMRDTPTRDLRTYLQTFFQDKISFTQKVSSELLEKGIGIIQGKVKNILELIDQLQCLFGADPAYEIESLKPEDKKQISEILGWVMPIFASVPSFEKSTLEPPVKEAALQHSLKLGPVAQAVRFAVTGGKISPGLFEMLEVQGKETVLRRIEAAIKKLS